MKWAIVHSHVKSLKGINACYLVNPQVAGKSMFIKNTWYVSLYIIIHVDQLAEGCGKRTKLQFLSQHSFDSEPFSDLLRIPGSRGFSNWSKLKWIPKKQASRAFSSWTRMSTRKHICFFLETPWIYFMHVISTIISSLDWLVGPRRNKTSWISHVEKQQISHEANHGTPVSNGQSTYPNLNANFVGALPFVTDNMQNHTTYYKKMCYIYIYR